MRGETCRKSKFDVLCGRRGAWIAAALGAFVLTAGCSSTSSPSAANTITATVTKAAPTPSEVATTTSAPSPTATETPASCTKPCADAGGWIAQLSKYKFNVSSGNEFETPEADNVFVMVEVTFINKSDTSQSADPFDFTLKSAGVEHDLEVVDACESWSSVDVDPGASYGPKCLAFQASAKQSTGLVVVWKPGYEDETYDIPVS